MDESTRKILCPDAKDSKMYLHLRKKKSRRRQLLETKFTSFSQTSPFTTIFNVNARLEIELFRYFSNYKSETSEKLSKERSRLSICFRDHGDDEIFKISAGILVQRYLKDKIWISFTLTIVRQRRTKKFEYHDLLCQFWISFLFSSRDHDLTSCTKSDCQRLEIYLLRD